MNKVITLLTLSFLLCSTNQIFPQGPTFEFHKISDIRNGYTLQSNGSPQQLWLDPQNPEYLHAVFVNSQYQQGNFPDRKCIYFGSTDFGVSWFQLGAVPDTSRSGFPVICGMSNGTAIISDHSDYFGQPTRTGLFIDNGPFENNFSKYDPGIQTPTIWPRCINISDEKILLAATLQTGGNLAFNTFNITNSTFSGWVDGPITGPETYSMCVSNVGKIGISFIDDGTDKGDVFYFESTDQGITWSTPVKIFDCPAEQGIAVGAMRGINLNFYGEDLCVVFETCQRDFNNGGYYSRLPNQILFWSPNINGGVPKVIADSSNVPFAPSLNPADVFPPLCRPVMGRTDQYDLLFIAFSASTENVFIGADSITYFSGNYMYSTNGGENWSDPMKFTPDEPLLDWKYTSMPTIFPLIVNYPYVELTLHFVLQADSLPAIPNPSLLNAQYYHASSEPLIIDIFDSNNDVLAVNYFSLEQNYPNPFNPSTKIKYQIPKLSFATIKIYDVLGNEIETLVNEEKQAGTYEVQFDGTGLPSGIYFYKLRAGSFVETKKMILMK